MRDFIEKRINVLVCSAIIESGLDIPNANTMIINRADHFGLAQLYQLRGRVGRSRQKAYAYLLIPGEHIITRDAKRRIDALRELVEAESGGGFKLAMADLEHRGAGNLLGNEQSGEIAAVGFELYTEMMEEAIRELRGEPDAAGLRAGTQAGDSGVHPGQLRAGRERAAGALSADGAGADAGRPGRNSRRDARSFRAGADANRESARSDERAASDEGTVDYEGDFEGRSARSPLPSRRAAGQ